jgi:hypothetical protein
MLQSEVYSPYARGISREEAAGRVKILDSQLRNIIDSVNKNSLEYERDAAIAAAQNHIETLYNDISQDETAGNYKNNLVDVAGQVDGIKGLLSPSQYSEAMKNALSGAFSVQITTTGRAVMDESSIDGFTNAGGVKTIAEGLKNDGAALLARALETAGITGDMAELVTADFAARAAAAEAAMTEEARARNLEAYRGKANEAQFLRDAGNEEAARAIEKKFLTKLTADANAGNVDSRQAMTAEPWFRPVIEKPDGGLTSLSAKTEAAKLLEQLQMNADTGNPYSPEDAFDGLAEWIKEKGWEVNGEILSDDQARWLALDELVKEMEKTKGWGSRSITDRFKAVPEKVKEQLKIDDKDMDDPETLTRYNEVLSAAQRAFVRRIWGADDVKEVDAVSSGVTADFLRDVEPLLDYKNNADAKAESMGAGAPTARSSPSNIAKRYDQTLKLFETAGVDNPVELETEAAVNGNVNIALAELKTVLMDNKVFDADEMADVSTMFIKDKGKPAFLRFVYRKDGAPRKIRDVLKKGNSYYLSVPGQNKDDVKEYLPDRLLKGIGK